MKETWKLEGKYMEACTCEAPCPCLMLSDATEGICTALVGWHIELYVDSTELTELFETLVSLPAVSIDHLGLSKAGFPTLLKLAEKGVRVKATGFGRVDFEVRPALADLYAANPRALMFGTDLPSTRAPRPYRDEDYTLVLESLGEEKAGDVFYKNAIEFYRLKKIG